MEWQLVQTTSSWVCSLRRILARERVWEWQRRQVSRTCVGASAGESARMVAVPPPASTCAFPGPWQLSQPVFSGVSLPRGDALVMRIAVEGSIDVRVTSSANIAADVIVREAGRSQRAQRDESPEPTHGPTIANP